MYGGCAGSGKMLSLHTPILTPTGWKRNGDLIEGDSIFDERGQVCKVTKAFDPEIPRKAYRLTFDDGTQIECGEEHLWLTYNAKEMLALTTRTDEWRARRRNGRASRISGNKTEKFTKSLIERNKNNPPEIMPAPTGKVRTTKEIVESIRTAKGRANHAIPICKPVEMPEASLLIDPYVLGAWLGDGRANTGSFTCGEDEFVAELRKCGIELKRQPSMKYGWSSPGLITKLRELGLFDNKHIPEIYLRASLAQRVALLQGLMDSDGYCGESGTVEFCNTNKILADAVFNLVISLGEKVTIREGRAMLYGKDCGAKYRVCWTPKTNPFRLERKASRVKQKQRRTNQFRYLVLVEPIKPVMMRCIAVDSPSHLFLAGKALIPTHNSDALLMAAARHYKNRAHRAIIFRKTFPELKDLISRSEEIYPYFGARYISSRREWRFPSGARVEFGYMDKKKDVYKYKRAWNFIGFDELTHWPTDGEDSEKNPVNENYIYLIGSRLRAVEDSNLPLEVRSTTNPGGAGHHWVKHRFNIPDDGMDSEKFDYKGKYWRIFIRGKICPQLAGTSYETDMDTLSDDLRKMLKDGRWDVVAGAMFTEFDHRLHTCDPFILPEGCKIWVGGDDGYNAPACILWGVLIDERIYIVGELYRDGLIAERLAEEKIKKDLEIEFKTAGGGVIRNNEIIQGALDSAAFNEDGITVGSGRGQKMNQKGARFVPAQKGSGSRIAGCNLIHSLLKTKLKDGKPKLIIFKNCKNLLRVLPTIQKDETNLEDVNSEGDDHPYDALRYFLQFKPNSVVVGRVAGV